MSPACRAACVKALGICACIDCCEPPEADTMVAFHETVREP